MAFHTSVDEFAPDSKGSSSPVIRKSCHFCRGRKIRCSGDRICTACQSRNLSCIYEPEAFKGRPLGSKNGVGSKISKNCQKQPNSICIEARRRNTSGDDSPAYETAMFMQPGSRRHSTECVSDPEVDELIGKRQVIRCKLEEAFQRQHIAKVSRRSSGAIQPARNTEPSQPYSRSSPIEANTRSTHQYISYGEMFHAITLGLIESVSTTFGSLGIAPAEDIASCFISRSIANDDATTMFATQRSAGSTPEYSDQQIRQMIQLWFVHHPLAFIVSKTLLLHEYSSGSYDAILLAVLLADAIFALEGIASTSGQNLFHSAIYQMETLDVNHIKTSTIQAMVLIGWSLVCSSSPRRGLAYLDAARTALIDFSSGSRDPMQDSDWINGVSVGKVEQELQQRMYWLILAIQLWVALQMSTPIDDLMSATIAMELLPCEVKHSTVFSLDLESGNVATILVQERVLQTLWPLSHIASTIAHIYVLYPHKSIETDSASNSWESRTLTKLSHLREGYRDLTSLCSNVRGILTDGVESLQAQTHKSPSQAFVVCAYRIILTHLLFPSCWPHSDRSIITPSNFGDVLHSVSALIDSMRTAVQPSLGHDVLMGSNDPDPSTLLTLGLDTCTRALGHMCRALLSGPRLEGGIALSQQDKLNKAILETRSLFERLKLQTAEVSLRLSNSLDDLSRACEALVTQLAPRFPSPESNTIPLEWPSSSNVSKSPPESAGAAYSTPQSLDNDLALQWPNSNSGQDFGTNSIAWMWRPEGV